MDVFVLRQWMISHHCQSCSRSHWEKIPWFRAVRTDASQQGDRCTAVRVWLLPCVGEWGERPQGCCVSQISFSLYYGQRERENFSVKQNGVLIILQYNSQISLSLVIDMTPSLSSSLSRQFFSFVEVFLVPQ